MGKLLALDKITKDMCRDSSCCVGFARILIEVNTSRPLPKMVRVRMPSKFNDELLMGSKQSL